MDTLARGLKQFMSVPSGNRIPVLLAGTSTFQHLKDGSFQSILDEDALLRQISTVSSKLGMKKVDNWIGSLSEIITGPVMTPDGFPGRISFPIFPFRAANRIDLKPVQYVERDSLTVPSFLQYFGMFKNFHGDQKPRVVFSTEDIPEAERFFSPIEDSIELYRIFPEGLKTVSSDFSRSDQEHYFDYLANGSAQQAASIECEYPATSKDPEIQKQVIIQNYFVSMARQMGSPAFSMKASKDISLTIMHIDKLVLDASDEYFEFLISAKIQFLLLKILVDDDDKDSLYEAITLSKAIEARKYEKKCLRFVNQVSGVSSYAIDRLDHSISEILALSRKEAFNPVHMLEYYAASQNLFITRLFNRKPLIDTGQALDCLNAAEDQNAYFNELGMLANSVGMSFLCTGQINEAVEYFSRACGYSADRLTNLNIQMNLAIARRSNGDRTSDEQLMMMFKEYCSLKMGANSQYHAAMMFGNLWQLASSRELKSLLVEECRKRKFITKSQSGGTIIHRLRKRGFLFMEETSFVGEYGRFLDNTGMMPAFHFNWSTPVVGAAGE